jgi:hypothetical protein
MAVNEIEVSSDLSRCSPAAPGRHEHHPDRTGEIASDPQRAEARPGDVSLDETLAAPGVGMFDRQRLHPAGQLPTTSCAPAGARCSTTTSSAASPTAPRPSPSPAACVGIPGARRRRRLQPDVRRPQPRQRHPHHVAGERSPSTSSSRQAVGLQRLHRPRHHHQGQLSARSGTGCGARSAWSSSTASTSSRSASARCARTGWRGTPHPRDLSTSTADRGDVIDPLMTAVLHRHSTTRAMSRRRSCERWGVYGARLLAMNPAWVFRHCHTRPDYAKFPDFRLRSSSRCST